MKLISIVEACDDGRPSPRATDAIEGFAIHRIGFDDWTDEQSTKATPLEIARRFIDDVDVAKYTGGEIAYTFLVDGSGDWWQCLRLTDTGKHARRWSAPMVGVGVIGDFRKRPPTPAQRASLVDGLGEMCPAFGIHPLATWWSGSVSVPRIAGHDELPGGSSDPTKVCPGALLSVRDLRRDVALAIERQATASLMRLGMVV